MIYGFEVQALFDPPTHRGPCLFPLFQVRLFHQISRDFMEAFFSKSSNLIAKQKVKFKKFWYTMVLELM